MPPLPIDVRSVRFLRTAWLLALGLVLVDLGWRLSALLDGNPTHSPWAVIGLIYDDAYYYLTLAANTAQTGRSTLDGTTLTNGYQPLWFLVLVGLARLVGTDTWTFFVAACVLVYGIVLATVCAGAPRQRPDATLLRTALAIGVAVIALHWTRVFLWGMETVLLLPLFIPLILLMERRPGRRSAWMLSLVFAMLFLVRLDTLTLVVAYLVVHLLERYRQRRSGAAPFEQGAVKTVALTLAVVVPVVAAYAVFNQVVFGLPVPVSGIAKAIGGPALRNFGVIRGYQDAFNNLVVWLAIAAPVEALAVACGIRNATFLRPALVCLLACGMQGLYYVAASTWKMWDWYFYLPAFLMALTVARIILLAGLLWARSKRTFALGAAGMAMALFALDVSADVRQVRAGMADRTPVATPHSIDELVSARRVLSYNQVSLLMLRDFLEPSGHTTVAMGDRAGGLSYWGRKSVSIVHTEGLLLGRDYIAARLDGTAEKLLEGSPPIDWYVVDREAIPSFERPGVGTVYVIADPIQALVTRDMVPVFCFPESSIRYRQRYIRYTGPTERIAFHFSERVACDAQERDFIRQAVEHGQLRRLSLPNEYRPVLAPPAVPH